MRINGMKLLKSLALIAAVVCVLRAVPLPTASAVDTFEKRVVFTFSESDFKFTRNGPYTEASFAGSKLRPWEAGREIRPGYPALPERLAEFVLPPDARVLEVKAEAASRKVLAGKFRIKPAEALRPLGNSSEISENPGVYLKDSEFPTCVFRNLAAGKMRGFVIASASVSPLRYNPVKGELALTEKITLIVKYDRSGTARQYPADAKMLFEKTVSNIVMNPEDVPACRPPAADGSVAREGPQDAALLIITTPALAPRFQPLADWRTAEGVPAEIAADWSTYPGADEQTKIKNMINYYAGNRGTLFVLLGGDDTIIPDRDCYATANGVDDGTIPADLYFACLDDSWDSDCNGIYGEVADANDILPDVIIGRVPVRTASQTSAFVAKTLVYEKNPPLTDFAGKLLAGGCEFWATYDGSAILAEYGHTPVSDSEGKFAHINQGYIKPYWSGNVFRFFDTKTDFDSSSPGDFDVTAYNMRTVLSSGYNHVFFGAHGNEEAWSTEDGYNFWNYDADAVGNNGRFSLIYTIACLTAHFDGTLDPCLGEAFIRNTSGGAVAYMGSSRYNMGQQGCEIAGDPAHTFAAAYFQILFNGSETTIGGVFSEHKASFSVSAGLDSPYRWITYSLSLFGDPSMPYYTLNPARITPSIPDNASSPGCQFPIIAGVPGASVCLSKGTDFYIAGTADSSGNFSAVLPAMTNGMLRVVITARNYRPYDVYVPVAEPGGPSPASNPSPADGVVGVNCSPTLAWSSSNGAVLYRIYLGTAEQSGNLPNPANTSVCSLPVNLEYETSYVWRVDAVASLGAVTAGRLWHFQTQAYPYLPGKAVLIAPANGAEDVDAAVLELSWERSTGAYSYDVYMGETNPPEFRANIASTAWSPGTAKYFTRYYWRIDARNSVGVTQGDVRAFMTAEEPGDDWDPWDNLPVNGTPIEPTVTPQTHGPHTLYGADVLDNFKVRMTGGKVYRFEAVNDYGYSEINLYADPNKYVLLASGSGYPFSMVFPCLDTKDYYLGVSRPYWSDNASYTLRYYESNESMDPDMVDIMTCYPTSGETDVDITLGYLYWGPASKAESYVVYFGTQYPPANVGETVDTYYTIGDLEFSTTYFWRVDSKNRFSTTPGLPLVFVTGQYNAADVYDPVDDYPANGSIIVPSVTPQSHEPHALNTCDRGDWFRFLATRGRTYIFYSDNCNDDTRAYLYMDDNKSILVAEDDDSGTDYNFRLSFVAPSDCWMYLWVKAYSSYSEFSYVLWYEYNTAVSLPGRVEYGYPYDGELDVPVNEYFSWDAPENASTYNLYFGTANPPPLVESGLTETYYQPEERFKPATRYYWRVDAVNYFGNNQGDVWTFKTENSSGLDEWDPGDDTLAGATELFVAEDPISHGPHSISILDNADIFKAHFVSGCTYRIDSIDGTGDPKVTIYSDPMLMNAVAGNDDGYMTQFYLNFTAVQSGYYYLVVSEGYYGAGALYNMNIRPVTNVAGACKDATCFLAVPSSGKANLSWVPSVSPNVRGYKLYVNPGSGFGEGLDLGNASSYTVMDLPNRHLCRFKLTAYNQMLNESPGVTAEAVPRRKSGGCQMGSGCEGTEANLFAFVVFLMMLWAVRLFRR
jgi:hypothetical protein